MAFFKKIRQKINGLWYPQTVIVGKPVKTDEVSDRLSEISTVSRADTYAVLKCMGFVMSEFMATGRTVKLEGLGTFYYTIDARGKGMELPEQVSASQIKGVRVRFIPEVTRNSNGRISTRSMVNNHIEWIEWGREILSRKPLPGPPMRRGRERWLYC